MLGVVNKKTHMFSRSAPANSMTWAIVHMLTKILKVPTMPERAKHDLANMTDPEERAVFPRQWKCLAIQTMPILGNRVT